MKVKCYAVCQQGKDFIAQYANPSQKSFIDYELQQQIKSLFKNRPGPNISFEKTSNGVWYFKMFNPNSTNQQGHLVLLSEEAANMSLATSLLTRGNEVSGKNATSDKIRMKVGELIKMCNANDAKFQKINSNVAQLEGIMKNNVSRIVDNMSDLQNVERKSQMMSSLSMQLEKDSRQLERKMKRRKFIIKLVIFGVIIFLVFMLMYMFFW